MKNLLGKWVVAETMQFNEEKCALEWAKVEDILSKGDLDRETAMLLNTVVIPLSFLDMFIVPQISNQTNSKNIAGAPLPVSLEESNEKNHSNNSGLVVVWSNNFRRSI